MMTLNDLLADGQAEAITIILFTGVHALEKAEDALKILRGNAYNAKALTY